MSATSDSKQNKTKQTQQGWNQVKLESLFCLLLLLLLLLIDLLGCLNDAALLEQWKPWCGRGEEGTHTHTS